MDELRHSLLRHGGVGNRRTAIEDLNLIRVDASQPVTGQVMYKPMICVIAQGSKTIRFGDRSLRYGSADYLLSAVDLPITGTVRNAAPGQPYLSLSLALDHRMLSDVLSTLPAHKSAVKASCGLSVQTLDEGLLDCFVRMTRLLDKPHYIASIVPLVQREILYRLVLGNHRSLLQQGVLLGSRVTPVTQVIHWIRSHYEKPFSVSALAAMAGMSQPSLHCHFRSVTAMSPLQYQKQVRLQEARRLLVTEGQDASAVAFRVGYASPSQFNREYRRAFGKPPKQDATHTTDQQPSPVA